MKQFLTVMFILAMLGLFFSLLALLKDLVIAALCALVVYGCVKYLFGKSK